MQIQTHNNTAKLANKALEKKIEKETARILELPQKRTKITLFMFSRMSADMQAHVRQHKLWKEDLGMQNHPHVVKDITMDIANGQSDDEWRKQHLAKRTFENFKQRGDFSRWVDFAQEWKNRLQLATNAGVTYEQKDLINYLMQAIDPAKFESIVSDYDRGAEHWEAVIGNYDSVYQLISYLGQLDMRRQERVANQLRRQAQGQTAFAVSEGDRVQDPRSHGAGTHSEGRNPRRGGRGGRRAQGQRGRGGGRGTPKCFLCGSQDHLMPNCPMKSEFEAFRASRASGGDQAPRQGQGSACAVTTTLATLPAATYDRQVPNYNRYDTPCYNDLCERSGCYGVSAATIDVDLIFDNATDVSVIGDERLALNLEPTHAKLIGFNGARSDAVAIATLPGRLGKALYVPGAQNLLGSQALADMGYRDQHRIPDSEGAWEIVHDDGEVLQFDPVDYDKKAHLKLSLEEYYALAVNRFLQPEPPHHAE